ncbi:GntR family transcriptional regulator [Saccharopolyspora erythraea NRRL 2338]|uniref:GntR-family transcriptional regulator n=2 Tax=Saccharopolyspora erythraea TaxID=1836 RepID=A4FG74_SACEN|nr:GntR family transcriptional regulator [Saccharopolyspora erythraea]EQD81694.1 GntR family transcriptional regulator [Saccharopolyspora erythraea D]PFG96754.1 GntR family transcriptional regulator [Saccharopolyspora erythraea NRRL 2338]QRK87003.1 GntR family transcriptional regulator [Saccharopolyspora erythraea]CAM03049.1 GntR-family transcriptional regulator [Saccharopolyspora erythraea NRRL 2338]
MSPATTAVPEAPAADRAYRHVKTGLLDGSFPDGHLLSEGEIATALRMSRTPVREAFLRLQTEGFLKLYPKRGALVVPVTPTEARALVEARLALESFAIDKLAALGTETMTEVGEELIKHPACDAGGLTDAELHEVDRAFHARLVAASGNPVVDDLYNALRDRQMRITATARTHTRRARITHQHALLAEAVRDGDAGLAKSRLRAHLLDTVRALDVSGGPLLEQTGES